MKQGSFEVTLVSSAHLHPSTASTASEHVKHVTVVPWTTRSARTSVFRFCSTFIIIYSFIYICMYVHVHTWFITLNRRGVPSLVHSGAGGTCAAVARSFPFNLTPLVLFFSLRTSCSSPTSVAHRLNSEFAGCHCSLSSYLSPIQLL